MASQLSYVVWGNWTSWWRYHLWLNVSTGNITQQTSLLPLRCAYIIFSHKTVTDPHKQLLVEIF